MGLYHLLLDHRLRKSKACGHCLKILPVEEFGRDESGLLRSECLSCAHPQARAPRIAERKAHRQPLYQYTDQNRPTYGETRTTRTGQGRRL